MVGWEPREGVMTKLEGSVFFYHSQAWRPGFNGGGLGVSTMYTTKEYSLCICGSVSHEAKLGP